MSTENVFRFLDKATHDAEVGRQLVTADRTATAWVATAKSAGFDFTVDDLRRVAETVLEKDLPGDDFVALLLGGSGELDDAQLESVAGGIQAPVFGQLILGRLMGIRAKEHSPGLGLGITS